MTWLAGHFVVGVLLVLMVALGLLLGAVWALNKLGRPEHWIVNAIGGASAGLIIATVVNPFINTLQNSRRDAEQEQLKIRQTHLERLRPQLRDDATRLASWAESYSRAGYIVSVGTAVQESQERNWYPNLLVRDFATHFKAFDSDRVAAMREATAQDSDVHRLIDHVMSQLPLDRNAGHAFEMAAALVTHCSGTKSDPSVTVGPDGRGTYSYGGIHQPEQGPPPAEFMTAFKAFREYRPDAEFDQICDRLKSRAATLPGMLRRLSQQAAALAEVASIEGNCPYLQIR